MNYKNKEKNNYIKLNFKKSLLKMFRQSKLYKYTKTINN